MRQATSGPLNRQIVHTECAPPRQRNARARHADLEIILIESGGDNLSATFSPELADLTIYVIDVAAGEDIPRKGGPALTRSDILVINKTDLAAHVGASLEVMQRDALAMRGGRPFFMTSLRKGMGVGDVVDEILHQSGLDAASLAKEGGS